MRSGHSTGKRPAQVVDQLPQIRARLGLARFGPQEERQVFAGLGDIAMQHEKRKQRLQTICTKRREKMLSASESQVAQQLNADRRDFCMVPPDRSPHLTATDVSEPFGVCVSLRWRSHIWNSDQFCEDCNRLLPPDFLWKREFKPPQPPCRSAS